MLSNPVVGIGNYILDKPMVTRQTMGPRSVWSGLHHRTGQIQNLRAAIPLGSLIRALVLFCGITALHERLNRLAESGWPLLLRLRLDWRQECPATGHGP